MWHWRIMKKLSKIKNNLDVLSDIRGVERLYLYANFARGFTIDKVSGLWVLSNILSDSYLPQFQLWEHQRFVESRFVISRPIFLRPNGISFVHLTYKNITVYFEHESYTMFTRLDFSKLINKLTIYTK